MLIIVESPAKAKTISRIFKGKHVVKASVGHIRRISNDKKTKDGRKMEINGIDIENDFLPLFEVDPDKKKVVTELKKLAKKEDQVLFATDSDREGEAISWHLAKVLNIDPKKVKRLEFHEITASALTEAMNNPRDLDHDKVEAQQARQVLDKLVGYKLSPVLWTAMGDYKLSAGRVQSPALVLVVLREKEIEAFIPDEYWDITGEFDTTETPKATINITLDTDEKDENKKKEKNPFKLKKVKGKDLPKDVSDQGTVDGLTKDLATNNKYKVNSIDKKRVKQRPYAPFTTSTLQQSASSRLGIAPRQTMRLAQQLYEGIDINGTPTALITYMRTDSISLSGESVAKARKHIEKNHPDFLPEKPRFFKSKNKNAQEAHEAIRPVDPTLSPQMIKGKVDAKQWKLYDLIWKRMVSSQMTECIVEHNFVHLVNTPQDEFVGSYTTTVSKGWKEVWMSGYDDNEAGAISSIEEGDEFYLHAVNCDQKFTKPPSRYSAASLIKKLEELGIGRPSTYASIISTLGDRNYVDTESKAMIPTALGRNIAELLMDKFPKVTGSDMTAEMEDNLDEIANGNKNYLDVLKPFWTEFSTNVDTQHEVVKENRSEYRKVAGESTEHPDGLGPMALKIGRFGEYWQLESDPSVMLAKNFREIAIEEKRLQDEYGDKVAKLVSPVSGEPMTLRVAKKTVNGYVATASYNGPKSIEKPIPIKYLEENNWTQKAVKAHYDKKPSKKKGYKKWGKKK